MSVDADAVGLCFIQVCVKRVVGRRLLQPRGDAELHGELTATLRHLDADLSVPRVVGGLL